MTMMSINADDCWINADDDRCRWSMVDDDNDNADDVNNGLMPMTVGLMPMMIVAHDDDD